MPMSEITVDMLLLSVTFQALSLLCFHMWFYHFFFQSVNSFLPTSPSQNIIWENFLKPGLQVSSCREDLFPVATSLGHNQPRLQLKTEFSTWGFSNHPYSVISSHKLYEGIWAYGLLCENISLPFRIRNEDSQCPLPFPGAFSHFILTLRI